MLVNRLCQWTRPASALTQRVCRQPPSMLTAFLGQGRAYHAKVIDHYERPRNVGSLPKTDLDVGSGLVGAPACGDGPSLFLNSSLPCIPLSEYR